MAGRTARAKCRQHIKHDGGASGAQAFVFELRENIFKLRELYSKNILVKVSPLVWPHRESPFARGQHDV